MSFKNVSLIHQVVRPTCLSTFSRSDERLKRRQTISTANTEAPYGEVNGSVGRRSKRNIQPLSWSATFFSLFLPLVFFLAPYYKHGLKLQQDFFCCFFFLLLLQGEHALQSGQHASYTESEHDATHSVWPISTNLNQSVCSFVSTLYKTNQ